MRKRAKLAEPKQKSEPLRFRIERLCPKQTNVRQRAKILAALPITVKLSKLPVYPEYELCDGHDFFRIDRAEANRIRRKFDFPLTDRDCCICEHMGTLIKPTFRSATRTAPAGKRKTGLRR